MFSPFEKQINDLDEQELTKLIEKSISEGWYIEYKETLPRKNGVQLDGIKIAKSLSAFANTKGGWLFYGIKAEKNLPVGICGVDQHNSENLLDQYTQTVSGNVSPSPIYHSKLVPLRNGKYVLAVLIEESPTPPYITSDGNIYQRENNQSAPIRDRYIIQKLTEKADGYFESIERFTQTEYSISSHQADLNQATLELYLYPLPFGSYRFGKFNSSDFFEQVVKVFGKQAEFRLTSNEEPFIGIGLGLNSFYSSQSSIIIRPFQEQNFIDQIATIEIFNNGGLKVLLPLPEFTFKQVPEKYKESTVLKHIIDKYAPLSHSISESMRFESDLMKFVKIIDGADLVFGVAAIGSYYRKLLELNGYDFKTKVGYRAKVSGIWRKFVFLQNEAFLKKIETYQIPVSPKDEISLPSFFRGNQNSLYITNEMSFFHLGWQILCAIGIPDADGIPLSEIITETILRTYKGSL